MTGLVSVRYLVVLCLTLSLLASGARATDAEKKVSPKEASNASAVSLDFLKNDNSIYDYEKEALNVSNCVTADSKTLPYPENTKFGTTCIDPDNFRIQVIDTKQKAANVTVKVQVNDKKPWTHTLEHREGVSYRGFFLRLVSDTDDDNAWAAATHLNVQTILVKLGDKVRVTYTGSSGEELSRELGVGRPEKENDNGGNQLLHDIRVVKIRIFVFQDSSGDPVISKEVAEAEARRANERFAQSTIRVECTEINMGPDGKGTAMPGTLKNGYDQSAGTFTQPTPDETDIVLYKDNDVNTIDVFYVEKINPPGGGVLGTSYPVIRDKSPFKTKLHNFIVIQRRKLEDSLYVLPHEMMHILLNAGHSATRVDPEEALFCGSLGKPHVDRYKRIGPFPGCGPGVNDTRFLRDDAETLPVKK